LTARRFVAGTAAAALAALAVLVPALHGQAVPVPTPTARTDLWRRLTRWRCAR
jgi:hypothetical protein